jgi:mannan endo-1,4-beta-mannosidase
LGIAWNSKSGSSKAAGSEPELITRARFGAYASNEPYPEDPHFTLESVVGSKLPIASWFVAWGSPWVSSAAQALSAKGGYDILCCWEAHGVNFADIISGAKDSVIKDFVTSADSYSGGEVVIRLFHESNGNWYDWAPRSGNPYVSTADQWIKAFQHVVTVGRSVSSKVKWMFCVNGNDSGGPTAEALWPGSGYVDVIGHDAYALHGLSNGSFDTVHSPMYARVANLDATAPYWIGETGIGNQNGASGWYQDAYASRRLPRVSTVCWFNTQQFTITADPASLAVHKAQLARMPGAVSQ